MNQFDIYNHRPRKILCIANDDRGGMCVNGKNATMLEVGKQYSLLDVEIHSWYTLIRLKEYPTIQFNSVYFAEINKQNKTISEQLERIKTEMCDSYCKWPEMQVQEGQEDWLHESEDSPCNHCPLCDL